MTVRSPQIRFSILLAQCLTGHVAARSVAPSCILIKAIKFFYIDLLACSSTLIFMKRLNLLLAFSAGLLGGLCSRYFSPPFVHAQSEMPPPREVRAQSFVLVNDKGLILGTFSAGARDRPVIKLFDVSGHDIWSAGGPSLLHPHTGK